MHLTHDPTTCPCRHGEYVCMDCLEAEVMGHDARITRRVIAADLRRRASRVERPEDADLRHRRQKRAADSVGHDLLAAALHDAAVAFGIRYALRGDSALFDLEASALAHFLWLSAAEVIRAQADLARDRAAREIADRLDESHPNNPISDALRRGDHHALAHAAEGRID